MATPTPIETMCSTMRSIGAYLDTGSSALKELIMNALNAMWRALARRSMERAFKWDELLEHVASFLVKIDWHAPDVLRTFDNGPGISLDNVAASLRMGTTTDGNARFVDVRLVDNERLRVPLTGLHGIGRKAAIGKLCRRAMEFTSSRSLSDGTLERAVVCFDARDAGAVAAFFRIVLVVHADGRWSVDRDRLRSEHNVADASTFLRNVGSPFGFDEEEAIVAHANEVFGARGTGLETLMTSIVPRHTMRTRGTDLVWLDEDGERSTLPCLPKNHTIEAVASLRKFCEILFADPALAPRLELFGEPVKPRVLAAELRMLDGRTTAPCWKRGDDRSYVSFGVLHDDHRPQKTGAMYLYWRGVLHSITRPLPLFQNGRSDITTICGTDDQTGVDAVKRHVDPKHALLGDKALAKAQGDWKKEFIPFENCKRSQLQSVATHLKLDPSGTYKTLYARINHAFEQGATRPWICVGRYDAQDVLRSRGVSFKALETREELRERWERAVSAKPLPPLAPRSMRQSSRFQGVSRHKCSTRERWEAKVPGRFGEGVHNAKTHDTEIGAAKAYDAKYIQIHGDPYSAALNWPATPPMPYTADDGDSASSSSSSSSSPSPSPLPSSGRLILL